MQKLRKELRAYNEFNSSRMLKSYLKNLMS